MAGQRGDGMRGWFAGAVLMVLPIAGQTSPLSGPGTLVVLPELTQSDGMSVEQALRERRSVRSYGPGPLILQEIAQLLWAAQGISEPGQGFRTAPSAGATFPLEIDLLVTGIPELPDGIYRYRPRGHRLELRVPGDRRGPLQDAAFGQSSIGNAPVVMVISGVTPRTARRYGARAERYVHMEAGHAAQNVYLQGTALGVGTVVIGAFRDDSVAATLNLERSEEPLCIMPLGRLR
jgi:SagB-type dehydrogenase family enzyme